jgi:hypothetical protein
MSNTNDSKFRAYNNNNNNNNYYYYYYYYYYYTRKSSFLHSRFPGKVLKEAPSDYKSRATPSCLVKRCWSCGFHDRELQPAEELSNF